MGQCVLIIGTIAHMVIDEDIRLNFMEYFSKCPGIFGVIFNEIPVQIIIPGIASETVIFWSILIGSSRGISVQTSSNVINRNRHQNCELWHFNFTLGNIPKKHHGCIDPIGLTGMDAVID